MDNKLEQLKKDLVQEIKDLAQSIAKSDSFVGLLSNEIKFRTLQEKFIVLKFLEQKKLSLDIFDLPILTREEKREILEQEGFFDDEKPVVFDFDVKQKKEEEQEAEETTTENKEEITEELLDEEIEKVLEEAEKLSEINKYITPSENIENSEEKEEEKQEPEQPEEIYNEPETEESEPEKVEKEKDNSEFLNYDDTVQPEKEIKEISLDFNDKIGFLNQLFLGDEESMNLVINTLNRISDVRSSNMYLDDLKREMNWNEEQEEYFERLKELVLKRFD